MSCQSFNYKEEQTSKHPCYSADAHHQYARMHLPVAPKCNIQCNYCSRKYDCVNESRPGVTSQILSPQEAWQKFILVKEKLNNLSVVGIAGPGDALDNWHETKEAIKLIKKTDGQIIFCLSTNGLLLPDHAQEVTELGVNHVTVTVNSIDPEIGAQIYKYVNYRGKKYTGKEGAEILLKNQLEGIEALAGKEVIVKINIVMIKGINDSHIPAVVKKVKKLGAYMTNIMPLIPASGSAFEKFSRTDENELNTMRNLCQADLLQMRHCKQCRADAVGLLGQDRSQEFCLRKELKGKKAV